MKKSFYPLATNIIKLQTYNPVFELAHRVLFDWFVVKWQAFNQKPFFYSRARISMETGLKDDTIKSIVAKFQKMGILETELKGMPRVTYFTLNIENIKERITDIFLTSELSHAAIDSTSHLEGISEWLPAKSELLAFFSDLMPKNRQQKKVTKENYQVNFKVEEVEEESLDTTTTNDVEGDFDEIVYNTADLYSKAELDRIAYYTQEAIKEIAEIDFEAFGKDTRATYFLEVLSMDYLDRIKEYNETQEKFKQSTLIPLLKKEERECLLKLWELYGLENIRSAFMAYIDYYLEKGGIERFWAYFFHFKDGEFQTFIHFQNLFVTNYGYTEK